MSVTEPAIIRYGRYYVGEYSEKEFRDSLTQAFRDNEVDFIVLDSNPRGQKFLAASVAWAIDQGIVYNDRNDGDDQGEVSSFRLTEKGQKELLNQPA